MPVQRLKGNKQMAFKIAVFEGLKQSRTAHRIWTWLEKDGRDFDLLVLDGNQNFGQMLTESDQSGPDAQRGRQHHRAVFGDREIPRPTVLWNPDYDFDYFGDVKGVEINAAGDVAPMDTNRKQGYLYRYKLPLGKQTVRVIRVTKGKMPAWVVLYHELGHVKQYYEGGSADAWTVRLNNTSAIEAENLDKHENPICRDIGRPIRAHYKHSTHGFHDLIQRYSLGRKQNAWKCANDVPDREEIERRLREEAVQNSRVNPDQGIFLAA